MARWHLVFAVFVLVPSIVLGAIYKRVDEKGVVSFTDSPPAKHQNDYQEINLQPLQTYRAPTTSQPAVKSAVSQAETQAAVGYESLAITTPSAADKQHFFMGEAISVSYTLAPELRKGDQFVILLDGKPIGKPTTRTSVVLPNINRGEHHVKVQVVDAKNKVLLSSDTVTFFKQQHSIRR